MTRVGKGLKACFLPLPLGTMTRIQALDKENRRMRTAVRTIGAQTSRRASRCQQGAHASARVAPTPTQSLMPETRCTARWPESSLFGNGLRASGRGLTLEVLLWHGVDMYIEQLTHEDFTQTTRSAPVTAATTWTFLHRSKPCTGAVRKHVL